MSKLKRFNSWQDEYENCEFCMLEDLFKTNILEYIHIGTNKNNNMVKPMTMSYNIEKLRYFYFHTENARVDITLNIS